MDAEGGMEDTEHIVRYLAGRLSETEEARFESRVAAEPDLYKRIEEVLRLQEGLAVLERKGDLRPLLREGRWRKAMQLGAAAAILALAVLGIGFWWGNRAQPAGVLALSASELERVSGAATLATRGPYVLAHTRGEPAVPVIPNLNPRAAVGIKIVPSVESADRRYRVVVETGEPGARHAVFAALDQVPLGPDGFVNLFLDSAALGAGSYGILLSPSKAGRDSERFEFQVR
jgi:hypothetical protein